MIGQTFSHYRILESLGEGGMGSVYVAEDTHLGRRVAVKMPSVTRDEHHYRARFLREARAVSMLNHPNIASIYDYGETDEGQPFIVMELVKGPTLGDLLHTDGLTIKRSVEIIEAVAEALAEAHSKGIVHRDIKPTNIVMSERDVAKVLDFGLAKQTGEEETQSADPNARTLLATRTRSGAIVGTPLYLSPEQATGAPVDARSDIFALGALLYECIAGRPAFNGDTVIEIVAQVIHFDAPPPSEFNPNIPPELDRITLKALQKKPDARYQSAEELLKDLRAVYGTLDENGHRRTQTVAIPRETGRVSALHTISDIIQRPRLSIGAVLLGVLAVGLIILGIAYWLRPAAHVPSAECRRWYNTGTNALRDGAYYQASKALEQAVACDDGYALAHARLAEALMELDNLDRAKDEMLRVSTLVDRSGLSPLESLYLKAITATVTRDFKGAVQHYNEIAQQVSDAEKAQAHVDLARAFEKNEEIKKAVDSYIEATNRDQQYATAFLRVGILYGRQRNLTGANGTFEKADALYQALGNIEGRTEVFFQRGFLLNNLDKVKEARLQLQQALDMARANTNQPQQIKILLVLSGVAVKEGNTSQAQQYAHEAVGLAQANGMENLTARGLIDLGNVYLVSGDYDQAENYYKQGLYFAQRAKGLRNQARALFSLGSLLIQQNNSDEAVRYVEQALSFYKPGGYSKEASQCQFLLGRGHFQKGDYNAALENYGEQLSLAQSLGDQSQMALAHNEMGRVRTRQQKYTEALKHYQEGYAISKAQGDQQSMGYNLLYRGTTLWQVGRYEDSRSLLKQSAEIATNPSGGYKQLLTDIRLEEAEIALSELRYPESRAKAEEALAMAGTQYRAATVEAKRISGLAQALSGKKAEGKSLCAEAVELAKQLNDPWLLSRARLALAESLYESGDMDGAMENGSQSQESFARLGQPELQWRALLLMARASERKGDASKAKEYAAQAHGLLSNLQQEWGADYYASYLTRGDIGQRRKQLTEMTAAVNN